MESLRDVSALVGRILLALIFVLSGLSKVMNMSGTAGYMLKAGIPASLVHPGLYLSIAVELGCGLLVIAGLQARWAALIIFLWLIPVTLIFHVAHHEQIMYMKNISMMGGLLVLAAMGPGGLSLDGRGSAAGTSAARRAA